MKFLLLLLASLVAATAWAQPKDAPLSKDITLVYITDDTIEHIGSFPFNRKVYGEYLDALYSKYQPAVAYLDLFIVDPNKDLPDSDVALAESVKGKENVVFGAVVGKRKADPAALDSAWMVMPDRSHKAQGALFPLTGILQNGAQLGMASIFLNGDGYYNAFPTLWMIDGAPYPSVPLVLAEDYAKITDPQKPSFLRAIYAKIETDPKGAFKVDLDNRFTTVQMQDILDGTADPEVINGRIVMLGVHFSGSGDMKPIGRKYLISGTEFVANATQTLLNAFPLVKKP